MNPAASLTISDSNRGIGRAISFADTRVLVASVFVLAFVIRLLVRLSFGEEYFWSNSYSLFYQLAERLAAGHGLSYEWVGMKYAHRPPVYPALLAATMIFGKSYIAIVVLQSIIGAGTALCAYFIGREIFDKNAALIAAVGVSLYPYFVMHDTALQETGLFTFLTSLSVLLLLKSRGASFRYVPSIAGMVLGLAILTRATLIVFVPFALLWMFFMSDALRRNAARKTALVVMGLLLMVAPWLARNYFQLGAPTITTLTGLTLWAGNNAHTFANYPDQTIDRSVATAWRQLPPADASELARLSSDEIGQDAFFRQKAVEYMTQHPKETFVRMFRKVGAAFSWTLNPRRERFVQTVYFVSYVPVLVLGVLGVWFTRKRWNDYALILGLFLSFIIVTAVFFAHTSHRVFLDVYLIIFAAFALKSISTSLMPQRLHRGHSN